MPRKLPSLEKPLVALHPVKITLYALMPSIIKNNSALNLILILIKFHGITITHVNIKIRINIIGLKKSSIICLFFGYKVSFIRSFTPSATGCKSPHTESLLGARRSCLKPRTFRSINVMNATVAKANNRERRYSTAHKNIIYLSPSRINPKK